MDIQEIIDIVKSGEVVYIKDDFYDAATRIFEENGSLIRFLKFKGRNENRVEYSNETAFEIQNGGEQITEEEYYSY
jgi:hypothetical protein